MNNVHITRTELKECWFLIKQWWFSEERWLARGLLFWVFMLDMAIVGIGAWLTYWNKNFFNAFSDYDYDLVWKLMLEALCIAICGIVAEASRIWFYQTLQFRWRKWMTDKYLQKWLNGSAFQRIESNHDIDNADQRLSEDLRDMTEVALHLTLGFFSNLVTLITFSIIIWEISGTLSFLLFGFRIDIPGYMLWISIVYAIVASVFLERWGKTMISVQYEQQLRESDFRFQMMRIRENSDQIAISGGHETEKSLLKRLFARIEINWESYKRYTRRITIVEKGYTEFGILLAYLIIIPRYFARQITLGSIMQLTMSFTKVRVGFAWFVFQYKRLANLRSMCKRLSELYHLINTDTSHNIVFTKNRNGILKIENLILTLSGGRVITKIDNLVITPGTRLIIKGRSGAGKTTLLKALAGIWQYGEGSVSLPDCKMLFLPQEPYLPLSSLRVALCYPESSDMFTENQCHEVLEKCALAQYVSHLDDNDVTWSKRMSPGEKQRLAFAKCLLIKPDYLFMDEATSALDGDTEKMLFELLLKELKNTTMISVAHRETIARYHTKSFKM